MLNKWQVEFNQVNLTALAVALMQNKKVYELFPDGEFIRKSTSLMWDYLDEPEQLQEMHKREFGTLLYFIAQSHWMGGN